MTRGGTEPVETEGTAGARVGQTGGWGGRGPREAAGTDSNRFG